MQFREWLKLVCNPRGNAIIPARSHASYFRNAKDSVVWIVNQEAGYDVCKENRKEGVRRLESLANRQVPA